MTGNRLRERESDMQQRAPGWDLNLGPLQRGQSLSVWDAALPTELNGVQSRVIFNHE